MRISASASPVEHWGRFYLRKFWYVEQESQRLSRCETDQAAEPSSGSELTGESLNILAEPEAAGLISRYLPFDPATLRDGVQRFLDSLDPVVMKVRTCLLPCNWKWLAVAAVAAGTGTALIVRNSGSNLIARWSHAPRPPKDGAEPDAIES
jgi:hypothetical protein